MKYIYLGGNAAAADTSVIGVFDLDNTSWSYLTRDFLAASEKNGRLKNTAEDIPRSFIVCADNTVILTQPNTATIVRRLETQERPKWQN